VNYKRERKREIKRAVIAPRKGNRRKENETISWLLPDE
jgi:hypothetical protein